MDWQKARRIIITIFDFLMFILLAEVVYIFYQIDKHPEVLRPIILCDPYASIYQNELKKLNPFINPFGFVEVHKFFENLSKSQQINLTNVTP